MQSKVLQDTYDLLKDAVILGGGREFDNDPSSHDDSANNGNNVVGMVYNVADGSVHKF